MRIRRAEFADLEAVYALLAGQFREHRIPFTPEALREAISGVFAEDGRGWFLLAQEGEQAIGLAAVSLVWTLEHGGKSAWLDELYVRPENRSSGVGRALLQAVIAQAREEGNAALDLEVDHEHNRAEELYKREGFERLPRARWVRRL